MEQQMEEQMEEEEGLNSSETTEKNKKRAKIQKIDTSFSTSSVKPQVVIETNTNFESVLKTLKSNQISNEEKLKIAEEVWRTQIDDAKNSRKKGYLLVDWLVNTCIASQRKKVTHTVFIISI
jgi:DNA helicase IV